MSGGGYENLPDYYRLLQVSPAATPMDVINAYRHAKLAYQQGSLAVYSLFSESELEAIRLQIEEAYRVLSDPERRREYDALYACEDADDRALKAAPLAEGPNVVRLHPPVTEKLLNPENAVEPDQAASNACGEALKRAREAKRITLEAIAAHTKISMSYLQAIEDEDVKNFPETVYLKGYLRQYSHEIGLDSDQVVERYLQLTGVEQGNKNS